eukprot:gene5565-3976_t
MDVEDGVTFLSTTLQALVASCLRRSHEDVEKEKRKLKDSNVAAEIKDTLTLHGSLELFANVIKYFMNEREQESDLERGFRMLAFQTLKDALGSETILLSDFYVALAANLGVANRLQEAIEFAGRGLLIRIRVLGVLSAKTAESHFQLGNLYTRNDAFDEGYRELLAARHIYCKLLGERSAPATDCDMLLGQLETKQFHHKKAYAFFARGFRHRYLSLGASDELTTATAALLEATRAELAVKCFLPVELLDRASELDWHLEDPRAFEHFLHVYLTQLPPDDVLGEDDVAAIVHKCYAVYVASAKSPTTPTLLLTLRGEQTPTSSSTASSATHAWTAADLDEVVHQHSLPDRIAEGHRAAAAARQRRAQPAAASGTGGGVGGGVGGDDKSGAKNALNALFGAAASGAAAVNDGRRDVAKRPTGRVPMPPPLPTSWPPLPFEGGGGIGGGGGGGLAAILGGRGGATGGGIGSGGVGGGGGGVGGEKRPKMKQLHLQGLASLDGTFWTATNEPVLRADELFDDLEDEFLIGGVKPKKPAAFRGGVGAGGAAGGLGAAAAAAAAGAKSPMGKAAPVESALDPQRAQNINIMLAKFGKRSLDAIAESVVNFDVAAVGVATVTSLQQFVPTPDEFAKVRAFVEKKWKAAGGAAGAAGGAAGAAGAGAG